LVNPDQIERARELGPISSREVLGKESMIFEHVDIELLNPLGELHVPSVADLFVAKIQRR